MSADSVARASNEGASKKPLEIAVRVEHEGFELEIDQVIDAQGVTAVFGPSGCGKTTLLRTIAGFDRPASGVIRCGPEIWFDSDASIDRPPHRRPIGLLFQDGRLFEHLDVAGNLAYGESRRGRPLERFTRADVVASLELTSLMGRRVQGLSGGERQRVALGRTLLSNPEWLLLDEPLSGLDRDRRAAILPYLEDVTRRFEIPTLYVSHDIDEVARLADRVWVLEDGSLVRHGPTAAIVERLDLQPLTGRFEAGVVVEGRVTRHDARLHLTYVDLHGDEFTMPLVDRLAVGDAVRLRIRARDVAIAMQRPEGLSIRNVLAGRVSELVHEPATGSVEAFIELQEDRIRARLTLAAVEDLGLEVGHDVFALVKTLSFEPED